MSAIFLFTSNDPNLQTCVIDDEKELDTLLSFFGYISQTILQDLYKNRTYTIGEGTIDVAKFKVGDYVELPNGTNGFIEGYDWDVFSGFLVMVEHAVNVGTFSRYDENDLKLVNINGSPSESTIKFEIKKEDSHICCGIYNKECKIVESYIGIGSNKGDKFLYCRTHKVEVPPLSLPNKNIDDWGY